MTTSRKTSNKRKESIKRKEFLKIGAGAFGTTLATTTLLGRDQIQKSRVNVGIKKSNGDWVWIIDVEGDSNFYESLVSDLAVAGHVESLGSLLAIKPPNPKLLTQLDSHFSDVLGGVRGFQWLPIDQLAKAVTADEAQDVFIGGLVDSNVNLIALIRGNLDRLVAPLSLFTPSGKARPNFQKLEFDDYGNTIRFGSYEASADAVLYERDADYRRRINAQRRATEKGFGPSLRRLRIQRGLKRTDFAGLSSKTIARIERGDVDKPHAGTLRKLSDRLDVEPDEIESY